MGIIPDWDTQELKKFLDSCPRKVSADETARRMALHDCDDLTPTERLGVPPKYMEDVEEAA